MRSSCVVVIALSALTLVGCGDEVRRTGKETPSELVENGVVYERAVAELRGAVKVVLPKSAVVRRSPTARDLQLFMAKQLEYGGFPEGPLTLRQARAYMGCAVKVEGRTLRLGTYGEWKSRIEGGASIMLIAVVPDAVQLELRGDLSGAESIANEPHTPPYPGKEGTWGGPTVPAKGWTAVPSVPDPDETAKGVLVQ